MLPVHSVERKEELASYQRNYRVERFATYTCNRLKRRAASLGVPFDLEPADIVVPARCPVLGIPIRVGAGGQRDDAPSVDRVRPRLGYVKGNVRVISMKANRVKNDATPEELQLVLEDLRRLHGRSK